MDGFSLASATATCASLSHRATTSAAEIDEILKYGAAGDDPTLQKLAVLRTKIRQFKQHVEHLEECLRRAAVLSRGLQEALSGVLPACDGAVARMSKELMGLGPETSISDISKDAIAMYEELLGANALFFIFAMQMSLITTPEEQEKKLDTSNAKGMLKRTFSASRAVSQSSGILLGAGESSSSATAGPSTSTPGTSAKTAAPDFDAPPPPFEATPPSYAPAPTDPDNRTIGKSGFSFSSLTYSLKAMTAAMLPKPEPFVVPLCEAASRGNIQQVKGLLGEGANINGRNQEGNTPLICAIANQQIITVEYLLAAGADIQVRDNGKKRKTPVFHAFETGSEPVIDLLLARGADVNAKSVMGEPIFVSVFCDADLRTAGLLLRYGANLQATDINGQPLIAKCLQKKREDLVKLLLQHGADANATNLTGQPLLTTSFHQDNLELMNLLLAHGASVHATLITGVPVVVEAIRQGKLPIAELLLSHGADANGCDIVGTPILVSTLTNGALSAADKEATVHLLLAHGANPNQQALWGVSLLMLALQNNSMPLARLLLARGADPNQPNAAGQTPLLFALDHARRDAVEMLLEHGARPSDADKAGRTPLMVALQRGWLDVAKALVKAGADVNQTGHVAPLVLARLTGDEDFSTFLREHGAKGEQSGRDGAEEASAPATQGTHVGSPARSESPPPAYDEALAKETGGAAK